MKVDDLFELYQGNGFELLNMNSLEGSDINFVSRTAQNNGVVARVEMYEDARPFDAGLITVALGGSVLSSFVQIRPFYTSFHIMVLKPKKKMEFNEKLYYCMCIQSNAYRYSYGRQANKTLKNIDLPEAAPSWCFEAAVNPITTNNKATYITTSTQQWKDFLLSDLFFIERGRGPRISNMSLGTTPFITSIDDNNGLTAFVDCEALHKANTLSVNRNGSVAEAFYQHKDYCSTEDVHVFNPKFEMNLQIGLFICTLLKLEKYRYGYGRKWGIERMNNTYIRLPVSGTGEPAWDYMKQYIDLLPYADRIG